MRDGRASAHAAPALHEPRPLEHAARAPDVRRDREVSAGRAGQPVRPAARGRPHPPRTPGRQLEARG